MNKSWVIDQNSEKSVMRERLYLSKMHSKFIVNMICSFQDETYLYLCLELKTGGDLRFHLMNYYKAFNETQVKFLLACLLMGIDHIHSKNIIHRDLKPENILLDGKGYAFITDFNISCQSEEINSLINISGTPAYMAPESIFLNNQGFAIDFYSLGIICYECLMGERPYDGENRKDLKTLLKGYKVFVHDNDDISEFCQHLINGLLEKNPAKRMGSIGGASEIKVNVFFDNFNWEYLKSRKYVSPLKEVVKYSKFKDAVEPELFDKEYVNKPDEIDEETNKRLLEIVAHKNYQNYFRQYTFFSKKMIEKRIENYRIKVEGPKNYSCQSMDDIHKPQSDSDSSKKESKKISNKDTKKKSKNESKFSKTSKKNEIRSLPSLNLSNRRKIEQVQNYAHNYIDRYTPFSQRLKYNIRSNDDISLKNYYQYKLNKYQRLLGELNNNINYPPLNNGNDMYNQVCKDIQKKLYLEIFGDQNLNLNEEPPKIKKPGKPNQYQINNYYPPKYMVNPYNDRAREGFFLPDIKDHHHSQYEKSSSSSYLTNSLSSSELTSKQKKTESKESQSKKSGSKNSESKQTESKKSGSKNTESKKSESKESESQKSESKKSKKSGSSAYIEDSN